MFRIWSDVSFCRSAEYRPFEASSSAPPSSIKTMMDAVAHNKVREGSWNIRGCVRLSTRHVIDQFLFSVGLYMVCLQETLDKNLPNTATGSTVEILGKRRRSSPSPLGLMVWKPINDSLCLILLRLISQLGRLGDFNARFRKLGLLA